MSDSEELKAIHEKLDAVLEKYSNLHASVEKYSNLHADVEVLKAKMGTIMAIGSIVMAALVSFIMGLFKVGG